MKREIRLAALSVVFVLASGLSYGQNAALTPFDKLPDWTGTWVAVLVTGGGPLFEGGPLFDPTLTGKSAGTREYPPYTAEYEKRYEANLALHAAHRLPDTNNICGIPANFPRILNTINSYEFVIRPDEFYIIAEYEENAMRVYTDGRPLPKKEDTWGTYTGVSVGHWEGDTLVFETIGLKGDRDKDAMLDRTGLVLSDASDITTRMRKINDNTLQAVVTIVDPKALTKPWVVTREFKKQKPGIFLYDYGCAENNRNPVDISTGEVKTLGPDGKVIK